MPNPSGGFKPPSNTQLPSNIQSMIQAITGGETASQQPQQSTNTNFWNPNDGVQKPTIGNTPQTTTPFTPFAMPQNKPLNGGMPPPSPNYNMGAQYGS